VGDFGGGVEALVTRVRDNLTNSSYWHSIQALVFCAG